MTLRQPSAQEHARGRHIERRLFDRLCKARETGHIAHFMQPDAVCIEPTGRMFMVEAKGQSMYTAPPFDGHGLPVSQALRYKLVHSASGIDTLLWVVDDSATYSQWLSALEADRFFDTTGSSTGKRRIYPLSNFQREVA